MKLVVFTNGCFDILHPGHIDLLERARNLGDKLIVGINSDSSVRRIKGRTRPYYSQEDRTAILSSLRFVDEVRIFDEATPENLIKDLKPDVLVKGGDWKTNEIVGADFVQSYGGKVFSIPLKQGFSTTALIEKIKENSELQAVNKSGDSSGIIENSLNAHLETVAKLLDFEIENIERCAEIIFSVFQSGKKVLLCGNGGSAADAQHIAAEFVGRYETERKGSGGNRSDDRYFGADGAGERL
jgi:rfaE bifunctional protein nucleotidyltransferase chain/domain